jgi:cob(I)alamin adenosyltransferase
MKLYTATGDAGETSLFDGTRVRKNHPRVAAYGDIDELNASLGWCRAAAAGTIAERLEPIQHELFVLGAELATPAGSRQSGRVPLISSEASRRLETWIDEATAAVTPLRNFILPGGSEAAARLHMARTCCRRAERAVIGLAHDESVRPEAVVYLNRLSDLLFAWARLANALAGSDDVVWISPR